jgi:hypothetical protein
MHLGNDFSTMRFGNSISDVRLGSNSATCVRFGINPATCASFDSNYNDVRVLRHQLQLRALRQPFSDMRHCAFLLPW